MFILLSGKIIIGPLAGPSFGINQMLWTGIENTNCLLSNVKIYSWRCWGKSPTVHWASCHCSARFSLHGTDTVQTFSEPAWKTDLSEKEGGWSGWINYTAVQRALPAHGRGTPQRWMERWRCCFLAGPRCLMSAVLRQGSTRLSKGIQFTVKQGGRSHSLSLPVLTPTAFGVHLCACWTHS